MEYLRAGSREEEISSSLVCNRTGSTDLSILLKRFIFPRI